jgi:DNA invertase Pin-like site-specific DNA recombinase
MQKKKAKLYERVASFLQDQEPAIQEQHDLLTAYCAANDIEITGTYVDYATGSHVDRPAFKQMLADLIRPENDTKLVLFTKWDRLCRNYEIAQSAMNVFQQMGVRLESILELGTTVTLKKSIFLSNESDNK